MLGYILNFYLHLHTYHIFILLPKYEIHPFSASIDGHNVSEHNGESFFY